MPTLHAYFLREVLKTFALATIALTLLLTIGGGVLNVLRYEGLGTSDLPLLTPLLLPLMLPVAMVVAAIFAATLTYGRLAADNEILACRAAGINVHRLFGAALLLALFVGLVTLVAANIVVPRIASAIDLYARNNLGVLAANRLQSTGFIDLTKEGRDAHLITCAGIRRPTAVQLRANGFDTDSRIQYLLIERPQYMQRDSDNQLKRFISAEWGFCQFDARQTPMALTVTVRNAIEFEPTRGSAFVVEQSIGPFRYGFPSKQRTSLVDLRTLRQWLRAPWLGGDVKAEFERFVHSLQRWKFFQFALAEINAGRPLTLADGTENRAEVRAARAELSDQGLGLDDVTVTQTRSDGAILRTFHAARGFISAQLPRANDFFAGSLGGNDVDVRVRLLETMDRPVEEIDPRAAGGPQMRSAQALDGLLVPPAVRAETAAIAPNDILNPQYELPLPEKLAESRTTLIQRSAKLHYKVLAMMHFRFAIALAVLLTILIGATLGVAFRGNQMLSAFGLACIPGGVVAFLIFFGKSLAEKAGAHPIGLGVMWGGLAAVLVLEFVLLRTLVRR